MNALSEILVELDSMAPLVTAESWDNVGLLVGDYNRSIARIMTCLTVTDRTIQEAIDSQAELIVSHHPIPFKPLNRITTESTTGRLLLRAIEKGIAIYSPHTAWDNAHHGINAQLANLLNLENVTFLQPFSNGARATDGTGVGRQGTMPVGATINTLQQTLESKLVDCRFRSTHATTHSIRRVGIVCGSGGGMLSIVAKAGCDAMLTGEATYHQCLEAESLGIALCMVGHHASEGFAMKELASRLQGSFPHIVVNPSRTEFSAF